MSGDPDLRETEEAVVPVLQEELVVGKQQVPTGGVRVHKRVREHVELVDVPLEHEDLEIRRVVVDREVPDYLPVRREGDTTIVPIVEEVLVVEKRLRLKEEVYITRRRVTEQHQERVILHSEEADVTRVDQEGREHLVETKRPVLESQRPLLEDSGDRKPRIRKNRILTDSV
jgi:uncharacterized protein (TIGR02271 family)